MKARSEEPGTKPAVAVTMGDPTGIGPEVIIKAVADHSVQETCTPVVYGDMGALKECASFLSVPIRIKEADNASPELGTLRVVPVSRLAKKFRKPGHPNAASGEASYQYIREAAESVRAGKTAALCTAPINKKLLHQLGHAYPGHTEMLADWFGAKEVRMMFVGTTLRVVLVTVHVPVAEVASLLTRRAVLQTILLTHQSLRALFGVLEPRIAVAALNPHAGEKGAFGPEERRVIGPAVKESTKQGILAEGPLPADTLFSEALRHRYDAVVCMYHDQGLIPLKLLDFHGAVNLTLGLPIVRTSVDHGTANDIAGKGIADHRSMVAALALGAHLAKIKG